MVKFNSPGSYVLSGGQDRRVVLCNTDTGAFVKSYQLHAYEVLDIAIARDSSMVSSSALISMASSYYLFFFSSVK